jgi:serine/threonine protein kinase
VSSFNILANLASDHDTDPKLTRYTLFDTFYRFLVLLGVPTSNHDSISKLGPAANRVLDIVRTHLIGSSNKPEHPEISSGELKDVLFRNYIKSRQLFAKHTATFNLKQGVHPAMARCRKQLGSNIDILTAMLDFDPRRRPTMRSLLMSPMFDSLRGGASKSAAGDSLHLFDAFKRDIFERPLPDV